MSRIKAKDTGPELAVRSALHAMGFRFRLHVRRLPGSPDLVFTSRRKVVFVHGCFWHGHNCRYGQAQPKSNLEYWSTKLTANLKRDARAKRRLRAEGWGVATVWECTVRKGTWISRIARFLED